MIFNAWHKSTRSGSQGNCVEVAVSDNGQHIGVRDSKRPDAEILVVAPAGWVAFVTSLKAGVFSNR